MKVVPLTDEFEDQFWSYVYEDPLDYYFFIFDWSHKREQTKIFLALDELEEIAGLLLLYAGSSVAQVRGSPEAVQALMSRIGSESVEISAPLRCKNIILETLTEPKLVETIILLSLNKGEENIDISTNPEVLKISDAEAVSALMRREYPAHWSDVTADALKAIFEETVWLGVKDGAKLAAIGVATKISEGSHIMFIATDAAYRNRGYATSIVSAFAKQILKRAQTAAMFVVNDNEPAKRAYTKAGFKPYKEYVYVKT